MKSVLDVKNLSCGILNNISFSLSNNTLTALIGKNNSGKTLLLKCISGISGHDGDVNFNGKQVKHSLNLDDNIGLYLGPINLSEGTVFSNIIEPLYNLEKDKFSSETAVYNISKKFGIYDLLYREINTLSYYEKNVVAFAKSIVHNPSVLLIDELIDTIDTYYKNKIVEYLKSLKNKIIIFVTNNSENLMLADKIMVICEGRLITIGNSAEIFRQEEKIINSGLKLPFIIDLSHKLKKYNLLKDIINNMEDMVEELWK